MEYGSVTTYRKGEKVKQTGFGRWLDLPDGTTRFSIVLLKKEEKWNKVTQEWELLWEEERRRR